MRVAACTVAGSQWLMFHRSSAPKVSISTTHAAKRLDRVVRPVHEAGAIEFGGDDGVDWDPDCRRVLVVNLVEDVGVEALLESSMRCDRIGITELMRARRP